MAERKSLSVRVRFEILKRDGFRCRYCGATAMDSPIEIDHVVPVARGGTNDPENLVAACWACNSGKKDRPLDESGLAAPIPPEALLAQAEQIESYLAAQAAVMDARDRVHDHVLAMWKDVFGEAPPADFTAKVFGIIKRHQLPEIQDAMLSTRVHMEWKPPLRKWRYFQGILKNVRQSRGGSDT